MSKQKNSTESTFGTFNFPLGDLKMELNRHSYREKSIKRNGF